MDSLGPGLRYRRPTEADYGPIVRVLDDWWSGRRHDADLPRLWLQHFTGTSWLADDADGRLAGFLIGFHSPDRNDTAVCHLVGVDPNRWRHGIGSELYARCFADAAAAGRTRVTAVCWPGNRIGLDFHRALGFEVETGPDNENLYGTPGIAGYDADREDRAFLVRRL